MQTSNPNPNPNEGPNQDAYESEWEQRIRWCPYGEHEFNTGNKHSKKNKS